MTLKIHGTDNVQPNTISEASIVAGITGAGATVISSVYVTDNLYNNTGANAVDTTGGYIKLLGINFYPGSTLVIGSVSAISLTYVSTTELRAQLPAQASGEYTLYLTNPNGSLYIKPNGVSYSGAVQWITGTILPNQPLGTVNTSIQLEATGDGAITYTLQAGSSLPGTLILNSSTGLLTGNPPAVLTGTNFSFTVIATDIDLQSAARTFTLPVAANALPGRLLLVGGGGGGGKQTGGGAGGFIDLTNQIKIGIPYSITVGLGGSGSGVESTAGGAGINTAGGDTSFGINYTNEGIIALGGGRGGTGTYGPNFDLYINGGSGGPGNAGQIGLGLQPTSASGGFGNNSGQGGGGGAGEAGGTDGNNQGGDGLVSDITGVTTYYAGGGGRYGTTGGLGGGGSGYTIDLYGGGVGGSPGVANTGGGGGGGQWPLSKNVPFTGQPAAPVNGRAGGSGILVLKVPNTYTATFSAGTTYTTNTSVAGYNIYSVTAAINQTVTFS
jgi:hypothetical protein